MLVRPQLSNILYGFPHPAIDENRPAAAEDKFDEAPHLVGAQHANGLGRVARVVIDGDLRAAAARAAELGNRNLQPQDLDPAEKAAV